MQFGECHVTKIRKLVQPLQPKDCAVQEDCTKLLFYVRYQHSRNVRILHLNRHIKVGFFIVGINQWGLEFNTWTKTGIKDSYFLYLLLKCNTAELHATKVHACVVVFSSSNT